MVPIKLKVLENARKIAGLERRRRSRIRSRHTGSAMAGKVHRNAVGLAVIQGSHHSFTWGHEFLLARVRVP
jgi:hypothetical protein